MENVLLLHGLAARGWTMRPLAKALRRKGYRTSVWSYPTLGNSIQDHARRLRPVLDGLDREGCRFHLVVHSMGGVIVRAALPGLELANAGRLVMLGTPNAGSGVATFFARRLGFLCPALHDLADDATSLVRRLPEPAGFEVGVLAARRDNLVPLASTHLRCELDHMVINCRHGMLPFRREVAEHVVSFLRQGSFRGSAASPTCPEKLRPGAADRDIQPSRC